MGRKNKYFKLIFLISFLLIIQNIGSFSEGTWPPFDPNNPWPTQNTRHRVSSHDGITDPYGVSSYSITGGFIDSPVVLSNDGNYFYFYFYKISNAQTYLYRVSKSGSLNWAVEVGDVRGGAPIVIDAENYNGTKKDVILVQKFEGITAYFDDGSIYKTTADGSAYAKMSDNFMDVNTNGDILFSSLITSYNENRILTSRYFINRKNIGSLNTSAESIVISEQMGESALNDAESESSVTTDQDGYTYSVIGGRLLIYNENFQQVLNYDHDALQSLYTSHVTVGPNNTLFIASYAQSNQYGFLSPMGSVLKVKLSSNRTQVLSAVKITDNGDPYSNTPYVHSQIAVDSSGNAYYTTGMSIYQNNIYQGMETGRLLKLDTDNNVTTLYTGNNEKSFFQPPTLANDGTIYLPNGVVLDSEGNQLWSKPCSYSVAVDNNGHAYFATGDTVTVYKQREGGYPSLPGDLSVDESNPSADQITSESQVTITVNRLLNNEGSITVDYRTEGLSAVEGTDYLASEGTLTFSNQDTSESINLTYFNDRVNRGNRTFKLILENPTGCSDIPVDHPMEMIITINEDDSIDDTPPTLISSTPTDGETDLIPGDMMTLVFSEYIISGEALNDITLSDGENNVSITPTVGLKDMNISINSILKMATEYTLNIPNNAIIDPSGNALDQDLTIVFNTVDAAFGGGNGTPDNPYIIDSPKALYSIKDFPEKNYLMTQDIDMGASTSDGGDYYFEGKGWQPIPSFTGIFDGQNYSITNLNLNRKDESLNIGLFSTNRGKILNLNVEDSHISYENTSTASSHIGLIAGYNTGLIYHCSNDGSQITFKQTSEMTNLYKGYYIGGIVGTNKGTVSYSTNTATLTDESIYTSNICSIGGIAGLNDKQNATGIIKMCVNDASIDYPTTFAINNQVNSGGIVGRNKGNIFDSYNHKFIENGYGIIGMDASEWFATTIIERCYSISEQISLPHLAGDNISIDNIYQYKGGTQVYESLFDWYGYPIIGHTAIYDSLEEMKLEENYQGFDFEDTWRITSDFPVISPVLDIESLSVESNTVLLTKDETQDLNATITPMDATISDIYYLSNNSDVASVSSTGIITAVGIGETEVYAYTLEGLHTQTIDVIVTEPVYSISATPLNSFASKIFGYATRPEEQIVTITNSGNQEITLTQPTSNVYEISTLSTTTLAPEEISTFTVQPKLDLAVGSYAEDLNIEGTTGALISIALDFTVSEVPTYSISATTINSFASRIVGYTEAPASQEVTITNTGNQEVTLTQPTSNVYEISTLSTPTLAPEEISTFTVQPKLDLAVGSYAEDLNIEGTTGASISIALDFTVSEEQEYSISATTINSFASKIVGYTEAPASQEVMITNTGNQEVTLTQPTSNVYEISTLSTPTLAPEEISTFTVQPKLDLAVGSYAEDLNIEGTTGASISIALDFTVSEEQEYSISATTINSFASKIVGYTEAPASQEVMITNTGNQEVTLTQPTSNVYEISTLSTPTLAPEEISTFTVQPKLDLAVGSYAEDLNIEGTTGASISIALDFTVSEEQEYSISATTINSFASKIVGYTEAPASQEVTITNSGNQEVTLTQPTAENYVVGTLSIITLAPGEGSTFTVQPKMALELGNYEENITIAGTEGASVNVVLDFNVISPPSNNRNSSNDNNEKREPADTTETSTMTINGEVQVVGTVTRSEEGDQSVTVVTVDNELIQERILSEENASVISLTISGDTDVGQVVLNGQTIKAMENKESTLEIKSDSAIYSLPAAEINVENLSKQFGEEVTLEDLEISVRIGEVSSEMKGKIQAVADENNYQVVVEPIDFEITCTYKGKAVKISEFNVYVERMVPIPENIDPSMVTTGIVLNNDGTFSHVPTTIVEIDNRYYAKIKSLTNSTYLLIYNPVEFSDIKAHWAKDSIEAMASRLIISGDEENIFKPDEFIKRAEFTEIIINALGLQASKGDIGFNDVTDVMPSKGHIKTAVNYAIVKGYGNGVFGPENKITREQAMVMIARGMNVAGFDSVLTPVEMNTIVQNYTDETMVSKYALKGIVTCLENDIVLQSEKNNLNPKGFITRAEAAVLIQTMLLKLGLI